MHKSAQSTRRRQTARDNYLALMLIKGPKDSSIPEIVKNADFSPRLVGLKSRFMNGLCLLNRAL
jgi:hypothetical protein